MNTDCFKVVGYAPNLIQIEITDIKEFKKADHSISIGSYLKITDDNKTSVIAVVKSYKIKDLVVTRDSSKEGVISLPEPTFIIDAQPLGFINSEGNFQRGGECLTIPPTDVKLADSSILEKIYNDVKEEDRFVFSKLARDKKVNILINGNKFFSKHVAVLGSTGSGKSCTVAKILQEGIKASDEQKKKWVLNNSHIVIFDLHGEYAPAFPQEEYHVNALNIDNLILPYWLMRADEIEEFFIDTEAHDHNQRNVLKEAIVLNKQTQNKSIGPQHITYDSPIKFDIDEVLQYIKNRNMEKTDGMDIVWTKKDMPGQKRSLQNNQEDLFNKNIEFPEKIGESKLKTSGTSNGEYIRFISRLENKRHDQRLKFLFKDEIKTTKLETVIQQFIGYAHEEPRKTENVNLTIIDLSGIPFEVLSIVVSLINRLIFDFSYYYKKIKPKSKEVPILVVLEEAHNYVPRSELARYSSVKRSVERLAKEGRKYGISLMVVSQRPSEISETVLSQCNNFVVMRLTNPTDQQYVTKLLPDSVSAITESLPSLEQKEALIIGDSIAMPTIVKIDDLLYKPDSNDIRIHTEWKKDWVDVEFEKMIKTITKANDSEGEITE